MVFTGSSGETKPFDVFNSNIVSGNQFGNTNRATSSVLIKGSRWSVNLAKGNLYTGDRLVSGIYPNTANNTSPPIQPYLSANEPGPVLVCFSINSFFIIYEVKYNSSGELTKLLAEFNLECRDRSTESSSGYIAFDSSLPAPELPTQSIPSGVPTPELPPVVTAANALNVASNLSGQGQSIFHDSNTADFAITSLGQKRVAIRVQPNNNGPTWRISFFKDTYDIDPLKNSPMTKGIYTDVLNESDPHKPNAGLLVANDNYCNGTSKLKDSSFRIFDIEYDVSGKLTKFVADFVHQCGSTDVGLTGSIRYELP